mmetsp:Transcript_26807/g.42038  ORF Transcript_26807/g.42038 Transcript_26807/m.42038 type:complete len:326 (-) Transcript_26807:76-1053(-)
MIVAAVAALLLALPGRMPSLSQVSSPYSASKNQITSFDDNPPFKGVVVLENLGCPDLHRNRIRRHFSDDNGNLLTPLPEYEVPTITSSTSTENILKHVVNRLAYLDAPVDAKEVAESIEFYLRSGKRAIGAARRVLKNSHVTEDQSMVVKDLCSGHGLTGMLFAACNPPGRLKASMRVLLVDRNEPQSHSILRNIITEVCPWVNQDTVQFVEQNLDDYVTKSLSDDDATDEASIIISTHACGSLTDDVIGYAVESRAASVSVMPCCYTGTAKGSPYGVQRMFGVSASADIKRSFLLNDKGYHVDFAAIPKAITPMNRLIVAERRC